MATLLTPTLTKVNTFDSSESYRFEFLYSGNQPVKNQLVIVNNETSEVVYNDIQINRRLFHDLNPDILENGVQYYAQVKVFDIDNNESDFSAKAIFTPYTRPSFYMTGLPHEGKPLEGANLTVNVEFRQQEGDSISEIVYYLYDRNMKLMSQSTVIHSLDDTQYTYYGLENLTKYYVKCAGKSVYGFDINTGVQEVYVEYEYVKSNLGIVVTNDAAGFLIVKTNIIDVPYDIENDDYEFVDNYLIIEEGNKLIYHLGDFSDFNDFSFIGGVTHIQFGETLFTISAAELNSDLEKVPKEQVRIYAVDRGPAYYVRLDVAYDDTRFYTIYEKICDKDDYDPIDEFRFLVNRSHGLYNLKVKIIKGGH